MPLINLDDYKEEIFEPLPEGEYLCKLKEAVLAATRAGDDMINLTWEVFHGDHVGRKIWDRLVFSGGGVKRAAAVVKRLGLAGDSGIVDVTPDLLAGAVAYVTAEHDNTDPQRVRVNVPYMGYRKASIDELDDGEEEKTPF